MKHASMECEKQTNCFSDWYSFYEEHFIIPDGNFSLHISRCDRLIGIYFCEFTKIMPNLIKHLYQEAKRTNFLRKTQNFHWYDELRSLRFYKNCMFILHVLFSGPITLVNENGVKWMWYTTIARVCDAQKQNVQ